ncbi:MAG: ribonuclease H-like domain-containing protein [Chloroflexota bacterium]
MDFGQRLERLRQLQRERDARGGCDGSGPTRADPVIAPCDSDRGDAGAPVRGMPACAPECVLELAAIDTPHGPAFAHQREYFLNEGHGHRPLAVARSVGERVWPLLGGAELSAPGADRLAETAFVDVETTGLAGGTGVIPFLIGVARVTGDRVILQQFFLRDFGEESAQLAALDAALAGVRTLVTYNGKVFDWPLIQTRCVMNRMRLTAPVAGHIDLLFPARRIWQHHLPDCRLATVEERVLGHAREDDIPGELIPSIYFEYQRSGDARPLEPVLRHNRLDILTLISLLGVVGGALSDPAGCSLAHANELHGLGRWCLDLGLMDDGVRCLERARCGALAPAARERVLRDLAAVYKRLRQCQNAVAIWRELVSEGVLSVLPYVELAKHYEHVERDYATALRLVERAVSLSVGGGRAEAGVSRRNLEELLHRRDRLRRKVARNQGG